MVETKICSRCLKTFPIYEFKQKINGKYNKMCIDCCKITKKYYQLKKAAQPVLTTGFCSFCGATTDEITIKFCDKCQEPECEKCIH